VGEDPSGVTVTPQTDFADQNVAGAALLAFMQAKQLGLPLSLKSLHRAMHLNDLTEMDFDAENEQIEMEAESLIGMMVHGAAFGATDESFLDDPGRTEDGQTAPIIPPNQNVPIKPHTRGSPVPLKVKVGKKGASAIR
jgi:hypothetical protein